MPSYNQIILHIVFATKNREHRLSEDILPRVCEYLAGIIRSGGGYPLIVNGSTDHIHILMTSHPDVTISTLMRGLKAHSSRWVKETFPDQNDFAWQDGYSVFSVSKFHEPVIWEYIKNQAEHHKRFDSKKELWNLLRNNGVEVDERFFQ